MIISPPVVVNQPWGHQRVPCVAVKAGWEERMAVGGPQATVIVLRVREFGAGGGDRRYERLSLCQREVVH